MVADESPSLLYDYLKAVFATDNLNFCPGTAKPVNILRQCCKGLLCTAHRSYPSELLIQYDRATDQDKHPQVS